MRFETTHWSVVLAAGGDDTTARAALSTLCDAYWYPLYAYTRRWGASAEDAQDLTQGFLASLLERQDFGAVQRERGRFRAFLLASLKHYLLNDAARRRTLKRGAQVTVLPLPFDEGEGRYRAIATDTETPETLYDRHWALAVIERVLARLRSDWELAGRGAEFDALKGCLLGEGPPGGHAAIAERLGTTEGSVKVAVHRLRRKFQVSLRRDILDTVSDPADVEDEIRYLIRALGA